MALYAVLILTIRLPYKSYKPLYNLFIQKTIQLLQCAQFLQFPKQSFSDQFATHTAQQNKIKQKQLYNK